MYYALLVLAFVIGQTFFATVCAWYLQKDLPNISYWQALIIYFKKEMGGFVVAVSLLTILLFILPDFMNLRVSTAELQQKGVLTKIEMAQKYFRTVAVAFGVCAQWLAFYLFKRGKKGIEDASKKAGV